jgi:colicin import membrane protein
MAANPAVPAAPRSNYDRDISRGFKLSIFAHIALALVLLVKTVAFPGKSIIIPPTLRVDVVGLPDLLKQDLKKAPDARADEAIQKALKQAEEAAKKIEPPKPVKAPKAPEPVEKAEPDEMVLKPKQIQAANKEKEKRREKKLMSALDRIRALEKISDDTKPRKTAASATLIKGNKISKGSSLSGDARESDVANYFDSVRDRLQNNWEIPIWFKNQGISAKVQIFIDRSGRLRNFRFIKPSGNAQFDDAVKRTISESQPFPLPPDDVVSTVMVDGILVGFPL